MRNWDSCRCWRCTFCRVRWEIDFLLTFETVPFICENSIYIYIYTYIIKHLIPSPPLFLFRQFSWTPLRQTSDLVSPWQLKTYYWIYIYIYIYVHTHSKVSLYVLEYLVVNRIVVKRVLFEWFKLI